MDWPTSFSSPPPTPYWCPRLRRDRQARLRLFARLHEIGLVDFRARVKARWGIFFRSKKGNKQRLLIDAREVNFAHRPPPKVRLGGSGAIAVFDP
eukprot:2503353-Heterocapsa_arctica.AAC.1